MYFKWNYETHIASIPPIYKVLLVVAFLKIYSVYARYKHFIAHSQCLKHTHKYKQNKTGNTDRL